MNLLKLIKISKTARYVMSLLHNKMYSVTEDINKHTLYTSSFYVTLLRKAKGEKKGQSTL